jgi:capsular polysaccharide transport system permease protein
MRPPRAQSPAGRSRMWRTVLALVLREMSTRYGRTPGGYIWAIVEPLGFIILLSIGFSLLLRSPSLGSNFLVFYATGFLPFQMYQGVQVSVARSITFSKPLLTYPAVTWIDAIAARFLLNVLTSALVVYLVMTGIVLATETRVVLDAEIVLLALALNALLGLGIGALNCCLMGLFPTYDMVWSIATRPLFLASGICYIYEDRPSMRQRGLS